MRRDIKMELIYNIKEKFESLLSKCQESITFISGYVTIEAFDFVESIIRGKDLEKEFYLAQSRRF